MGGANGDMLLSFESSRSIARKKSELGTEPEGTGAAGDIEKRSLYLLGNSECPHFIFDLCVSATAL